jgi:hypothetical protein
MPGDISAAKSPVPAVVLATARGLRREMALRVAALALGLAVLGQAALLGVVSRRPALRLYVPDSSLVCHFLMEGAR